MRSKLTVTGRTGITGAASLTALLALAMTAHADTWTSTDPSPAIPDLGTAVLAVDVDTAFTIRDVNVIVTLKHDNLAQLTLALRHPDGTEILLAQGAHGTALYHTVFDDEAGGPLSGGSPYTASFQPIGPLAAFDGKSSEGSWRLRVVDGVATGDGELNSATLAFNGLTFNSTDVPLALPTFGVGSYGSVLTVPVDVEVADLDVSLYIEHTYPSDLRIDLLGPQGVEVALAHFLPGGFGTGLKGTTFDDEASLQIWDALDPYHGRFLPYLGNQGLFGFDGASSAGAWRLRLADIDPDDGGALRGWSMHVTPTGPCVDVVATAQSYGAGTSGTLGVPALSAQTDPEPGQTLVVFAGNSSGAPAQALLAVGFQLASIPGKGGVLLVDPAFSFPLLLPAAGLTLPAVLPGDASLCGLTLYLQTLQADVAAPQGVAFSRGLQLVFGA
jgi:subtilisin-like proprotein convertase family protein